MFLAIFVILAPVAHAKNGAFKSTLHGDPVKGPQRRFDHARGSCLQCHMPHDAHGKGTSRKQAGLFAENDNNLCFSCHAGPGRRQVFPGLDRKNDGAHEPLLCLDCHDPHGQKDTAGVIPSMLRGRDERLCLGCHDGSRAVDVLNDLRKPFGHPVDAAGKAECTDCHNPHVAGRRRGATQAPIASPLLQGVSGVSVRNGPAGLAPAYSPITPGGMTPLAEYEICFKCHSSAVALAPGKRDLALLTNPANASYHPIQERGRTRIDRNAFVDGWSERSMVLCTDCHGSDDPHARSLHGSTHKGLLKAGLDQLCLSCHRSDVYTNPAADESTLRASRFNPPAQHGHAMHAGAQRIACTVCHDPHGSTRNGSLITSGKGPGIIAFTQTSNGGTCTSACHSARSYSVTYPR